MPEESLKDVQFQSSFDQANAITQNRNLQPVIALLGQNGTVELWHQNGELIKQLRPPGAKLDGLEFSADNQRLITYQRSDTARGDSIYLWSTVDGSLKNKFYTKPSTESDGISYQLSPTDQRIATNQADETTQLVNLLDGSVMTTLEGHICGWSHDGQRLATCQQEEGIAYLWHSDGRPISTLKSTDGKISNIIFNPDNQTLAVQLDDSSFQLWTQTGVWIRTLQNQDTPQDPDWGNLTFSPDGAWLVIQYGGEAASVTQVWNRDGTVIQTLRNQPWSWTSLDFSADSQWLALADPKEGDVLLINQNGLQRQVLKGHTAAIQAIQFSPDGQSLATASQDATTRLWKLDGSPLMTLAGHHDWISVVAFSPDGKLLASSSWDRSVRLWNATADGLDSLTMTDYRFGSVFSEDTGRQAEEDMLVSAMEDGAVRLWRGKPIARTETTLLGPTPGKSEVELIYSTPTIPLNDGSRSEPPVAIQVTVKNEDNESLGPVSLWRPDGKRLITVIDQPIPHGNKVDVQTSDDGQVLLTAIEGKDFFGPVQVWQANGQLQATLLEQTDHSQGVAQLSQDGQYVAIQVTHKKDAKASPIKLWRSDGTFAADVLPEPEEDDPTNFLLLGDSSGLATWRNDKTSHGPVQLWKMDGTLLKTLIAELGAETTIPKDGTVEVSWDQQGQVLVTLVNNQWGNSQDNPSHGPVQLWQSDGTLLKTLLERTDQTKNAQVTSSPDGETFVVTISEANKLGQVLLWHRQQVEPKQIIEWQGKNFQVTPWFSPDSQSLINVINNGAVQLWDREGNFVKTLLPENSGWTSVGFSPGQNNFYTSENGNKIISIWDREGTLKGRFDSSHKGDISTVIFSPDGNKIATASWDKTIKLWTLQGGLESIFTDHAAAVVDLRFTADGSQLVSVAHGSTKQLILRDLANMHDLNLLLEEACQKAGNYPQQTISESSARQQICPD